MTPGKVQSIDEQRFRAYVNRQLQRPDYQAFGDREQSLLVTVEVLLDLLLHSLPPEKADDVVTQVEASLDQGDASAQYEMLLINAWCESRVSVRRMSVRDAVPERSIEHLLIAGRDLLATLLIQAVASKSRRLPIVLEEMASETAKRNLLAASCDVLLQVAFEQMQGAARAIELPLVAARPDLGSNRSAAAAVPICMNGHQLEVGQSRCPSCGARIKMQWMTTTAKPETVQPTAETESRPVSRSPICMNGHQLEVGQSRCPSCGARIKMQWMTSRP